MTQGGGAAIDLGREAKRPVSGIDREKRGARRADCGSRVGVAGLCRHRSPGPSGGLPP